MGWAKERAELVGRRCDHAIVGQSYLMTFSPKNLSKNSICQIQKDGCFSLACSRGACNVSFLPLSRAQASLSKNRTLLPPHGLVDMNISRQKSPFSPRDVQSRESALVERRQWKPNGSQERDPSCFFIAVEKISTQSCWLSSIKESRFARRIEGGLTCAKTHGWGHSATYWEFEKESIVFYKRNARIEILLSCLIKLHGCPAG